MWKKLSQRAARSLKSTRPRSQRPATRFRPSVEALEVRRVMDGMPFIDDMRELAELYPTKSTPTMLWLNFDGQTSAGVSAFQSGQREDDIQEVLFRTSEIFAPFNVQVARMFGDGNFDSGSAGNTTIFVGDIAGQASGAFTPWQYTDMPCSGRDLQHKLNSDPFDLAYVDPWLGAGNRSNLWMAQAIAHEAGHTFGLAHVLSSPGQDAMSYDATNSAFLNTTYDVTNLNWNPATNRAEPNDDVQPQWYTTVRLGVFEYPVYNDIVTQNSYATLRQLLGSRSTAGDIKNVADSGAVDPGYGDASLRTLSAASSYSSYINRMGDYDVFNFTPDRTTTFRAEVRGTNGSFLAPSVLVYDAVNDRMVEIATDGNGDGRAEAVFQAFAGREYRIIVGAENGRTSGDYQVSVDVGAPRGEFAVLDVQTLAASRNGVADQVELSSVAGHFRLVVNGTLLYSDRADQLREARITGTSDNETFTLRHQLPFTVIVAGGSSTDTLQGAPISNTWQLSSANAGTLNTTVQFSSFENLTGGSSNDTFKFAAAGSISGTINGGGGTDLLDYAGRNAGVTVDLSRGQATGTARISSIENITGSRYNDTLTGNSVANVLRGGAGNDTLRGGGGNDFLYGEAGADWLYGQAGMDVLDGGFDRSFDRLFGDDAGALAEADQIYNHLYWNGAAWVWEDDLSGLGALDVLIPVVHSETYRA